MLRPFYIERGAIRLFLVVGLGNPGKEYEKTRHNAGFMALDLLAEKLDTKINKIKFKGLLGEANYKGEKVLLLKPQTYMNLSGQSVVEVVNFYKIPKDRLIVIYDDMDLPGGRLRIKPEGSSGGQKGMESIIYQLASDKFCRIRIGIGRPEGQKNGVSHVLGKFYGEEALKVEAALKAAADAALMIISQGVEMAMNQYNNFEA
jgi:PTH1 family peptidyl-tRNA hydrolase